MAEFFRSLLSHFTQLAQPGGAFYWAYLLSSLTIAVAFYFITTRRTRSRRLSDVTYYLFPSRIYRHASARLDFKFFFLSTLFYGAFVAPMALTSVSVARLVLNYLIALIGIPGAPLGSGALAAAAATLLIFIAGDFGFFLSHYLQHKVPLLWEFHKVHHSAEVLHPITAFRSHPIDQILDAASIGMMTGLAIGISAYCFGGSITPALLLGTNVFVFIFNLSGSHLRHSHIWLSYGNILNRFVVSPAMHQIHHSKASHHLDKNLGACLSIWDRVMGTLYVPSDREELAFGLADTNDRGYNSVSRLYFLPLAKVFRLVSRRNSKQ
jgi:sterol desaturase/sphingolipid hydroxylase (fatty acid hydroxylase superfamily)